MSNPLHTSETGLQGRAAASSERWLPRRVLGRTGLDVTVLSFGAMNLRLAASVGEGLALVRFALDAGINLVDTARGYCGKNGRGEWVESEILVGRAIREHGGLKEPVVVVTKGHGYTLEAFDEDLGTSLQRLGVEGRGDLRIGENPIRLVYLFHGINAERWAAMKASGVLDRARSYRSEGRINHIGFSSHYAQKKEIREALDTGIFDAVELPYNVFNRELGEDGDLDLLAFAKAQGAGVINMKAFAGNGMPAIYRMLRDLMRIDYPAMLNFCLSNPHIATVDAGARSVEELAADIATALGPRPSAEALVSLTAEADKVAPHLKSVCRECLHCLEKFACPQGVDFPKILSLYARRTLSADLGRDTAEYVAAYRRLSIDAEACIECGECLPWCEYKLNVPDMLEQAHRNLG